MKERFHSLSGRLIRRILLAVLLIVLVISVFVVRITRVAMLALTSEHYTGVLETTSEYVATLMKSVEVSAVNNVDEVMEHLDTPDDVAHALEGELRLNNHLWGCGVGFVEGYYPQMGKWFEPYAYTADGKVSSSLIGSADHDYFNMEWYTQGLSNPDGKWSNPYYDNAATNLYLCTFSLPVIDSTGRLAGVYGADISLESLTERIKDFDIKDNETRTFGAKVVRDSTLLSYSFIIANNGDYIVNPHKEVKNKENFFQRAEYGGLDDFAKVGRKMVAGESGQSRVDIRGRDCMVYYAPLVDSGWSMAVVVPRRLLLRPGNIVAIIIFLFSFLGMVALFFICYRGILRTTGPLRQLAASAKQMATGNFNVKLPKIRKNDEVKLLRDSIEFMQHSLKDYVKELTETTAQKASMDREVGVARDIQMSIVPKTWPAFPDRDDIDIYGLLKPAKAVGGDLYDFRIKDDYLYFCIGDVSGKGIPASLFMTLCVAMFRTLSRTMEDPKDMLSLMNSSMAESNESMMFITLIIGKMNLSTGVIQYSNAGHNAPVIVKDGKASFLKVDPNVALGIVKDYEYSLQKTKLEKGSSLFLYTDGLSEATSADNTLFGEDAICENLSGCGSEATTEGMISRMNDAVNKFVGNAEQSDDLTMLAIKRL